MVEHAAADSEHQWPMPLDKRFEGGIVMLENETLQELLISQLAS
jgi:hypothetical protein